MRFHQLHATDHARIVQKRFCAAEEEEVPFSEVVKGYEIAPGRHVVIEAEEFAALEPAFTRTIEIEDFVQMEEIDPILFDRPYYLVPNRGGARSYRLLLQAMRDTDKVAIGRVVLRSRQQLVAIHPREDALVMTTMNFGDEVVPHVRTARARTKTRSSSATTSSRLPTGSWTPSPGRSTAANYRDTYREALLDLIDRKASGEQVVLEPPPRDQPLEAPDLMSALEASIEQVRARRAREEEVLAVDGAPPGKRAKAPAKQQGETASAQHEATSAQHEVACGQQLKEQPQNELLAGAIRGGLDPQLVGHTLQHAAHSGQHRIAHQPVAACSPSSPTRSSNCPPRALTANARWPSAAWSGAWALSASQISITSSRRSIGQFARASTIDTTLHSTGPTSGPLARRSDAELSYASSVDSPSRTRAAHEGRRAEQLPQSAESS